MWIVVLGVFSGKELLLKLRESKKSLKETGIKSEDVKNLPPIEL
jgi:hypothetical protein